MVLPHPYVAAMASWWELYPTDTPSRRYGGRTYVQPHCHAIAATHEPPGASTEGCMCKKGYPQKN